MYAYIKGEDDHFCFKEVKNRKKGQEWLEFEINIYKLVYKSIPEYAVITNKEADKMFPDICPYYCSIRRLGNKLNQFIKKED